MALLLLPLHTSLALLLPLPTQLPPVRRCPSPQCQATAISELGAALHQSLSAAPSSPAEANGSWLRLATLLCDGVYKLADWGRAAFLGGTVLRHQRRFVLG